MDKFFNRVFDGLDRLNKSLWDIICLMIVWGSIAFIIVLFVKMVIGHWIVFLIAMGGILFFVILGYLLGKDQPDEPAS